MDKTVFTAKFLVIALILNSVLISCKRNREVTSQNIIYKVDVENCKTSIDLKLSDLIDSCRLVPLETTNESLLGTSLWYLYITDDYIIIDDHNGIYLFAEDGKFINKIINNGRGPQELSIVRTCYYYEKKDLLFINDHFNNLDNILCYDVKSQTFRAPIKKCFSNIWGDFMVYNDSLIMGSPELMDTDSNPYAIFFQDFKGNFITGIKSKRKCIIRKNKEEILQSMLFYSGDQKIHVRYIYDDTLFALNGYQLSPYLITQYNSPKIDPPHTVHEIGDKRSSFEKFENSSFIIFRNRTYKGRIKVNTGTEPDYERVYFLLNKSNGNYSVIKSYTDDFIGKIQGSEDETITFPSSLPDDKLYILYYPYELLQKTSTDLERQGFPESVYSQLSKIKNNLDEMDNPVLLIGKPKRRLSILK